MAGAVAAFVVAAINTSGVVGLTALGAKIVFGITYAVVSVAVSAVTSTLANSLVKKPKPSASIGGFTQQLRDRVITARQPIAPRRVIYGNVRVGGVFTFISEHLDLQKNFKNIIFSTENKSYVDNVDFSNVRAIINFKRLNNIREINQHFISVNKLLPDAGIYIGRCESYYERRYRFYNRFGRKIGRMLWLVDFVVNRVIPKLRPFDKIYKLLLRNKAHVVSKAEILGRLVYNGFEVIEFRTIDGLLYFVVMKTRGPAIDPAPKYHTLIK